jgi:hypothetical protein
MNDDSQREDNNHKATQLHMQGRYEEAEGFFLDSLKDVEQFGEKDVRLALV